jgi:hypothetical protein
VAVLSALRAELYSQSYSGLLPAEHGWVSLDHLVEMVGDAIPDDAAERVARERGGWFPITVEQDRVWNLARGRELIVELVIKALGGKLRGRGRKREARAPA